jgi:hypothetical protein
MSEINERIAAALRRHIDWQYVEGIEQLVGDGTLAIIPDPQHDDVFGLIEDGECVAVIYLEGSEVCRSAGIVCDLESSDRLEELLDEVDYEPCADDEDCSCGVPA